MEFNVVTIPARLCQICCLGTYRLGLSMCTTTAWQSRNGSDMLTRPRAGPGAGGRALPASQGSLQPLYSTAKPKAMSLAHPPNYRLMTSIACHIMLLRLHVTDALTLDSCNSDSPHNVTQPLSQSTSLASDPDPTASFDMVFPGTQRTMMRGQNQAWWCSYACGL